MNKIDAITIEELDLLDRVPHYVMISAKDGWGLDDLLEMIWRYVGMVRVYTKPKGRLVDYNEPVILQGTTDSKHNVEAFVNRIHKGLLETNEICLGLGCVGSSSTAKSRKRSCPC
jgi:uncharacterized protein